MFFKFRPPGTNLPLDSERMPVIKVTNGDSFIVDAEIVNPLTHCPATPKDTIVRFALSDDRFSKCRLWEGGWYDAVKPDPFVHGLVHVKVPEEISNRLRRGTYIFSLQVMDDLATIKETQVKGYFQVEYEPTSETHDIPYRK
jgi:hypothetical protein